MGMRNNKYFSYLFVNIFLILIFVNVICFMNFELYISFSIYLCYKMIISFTLYKCNPACVCIKENRLDGLNLICVSRDVQVFVLKY